MITFGELDIENTYYSKQIIINPKLNTKIIKINEILTT
jgi:hypothetical protein